MNDLFKKLNVLLKAGLNESASTLAGSNRSNPNRRLDPKVDASVDVLRQRINEAVQYEDEIKTQIRQLDDEAANWDRQADDAVVRGDEAGARYAIEKMRLLQQRIAMMQSDLREHQQATQELIQRVNTLDAAVADAHHEHGNEAPQARHLPDLGNVLKETRERIDALADTAAAKGEPEPEANEAAVDDDLERRRQRLSQR